MEIMGIDIGGSAIKGAPVDIGTGELAGERIRIVTPTPAPPPRVAQAVAEIVTKFEWNGLVGVGFPSVVRNGKAYTAANIDESWIGTDIVSLLRQTTGCQTTVINDADAAGLAEMRFGAGRGHEHGVVLMITLGTGIGSAIFVDGHLFPNTELGHIMIRGKEAEKRASAAIRDIKKLSWRAWGKRVDEYLNEMERLIWPNLMIIGGGVSKDADKFFKYLTVEAEVVPATLRNNAGIVGAALAVEGIA